MNMDMGQRIILQQGGNRKGRNQVTGIERGKLIWSEAVEFAFFVCWVYDHTELALF